MSITEEIRQHLMTLNPLQLDIEDDSHQHRGHAGARDGGGHYRIRITSHQFQGLSTLQSHRLVYTALGTLMHQKIHALQLDTKAH